jgi:hypothetical protein
MMDQWFSAKLVHQFSPKMVHFFSPKLGHHGAGETPQARAYFFFLKGGRKKKCPKRGK